MERRTRPGDRREAGFTLAGVIVLLTIMMIFVAYTIPRQWSTIMQRERELQTIFIMKQYAEAIDAFSRKNGNALPASMDQITKAKLPRFLRPKDGEYIDPLTGEVDWLIIPASAAGATGTALPGTGGSAPTPTPTPAGTRAQPQPQNPVPAAPAIPLKDYAGGPFIGVRPGKTGKSFLEFRGAQNYEQWTYTVLDYRTERDARIAAASKLWQ